MRNTGKERMIEINGIRLREYEFNTVIVGSGAAGYNGADRLFQYGQKDIALVTEGVCLGTSRNTGSDKQTYYKLTLSGSSPDSVRDMAATLFQGQCADGDNALCEAALSVKGFTRLGELGVGFPKNRWGEYIGYKTDHDPRERASSAGPYTSRMMTECLQRAVEEKKIPVFDGFLVIAILSNGERCFGLLCLDCGHVEQEELRYAVFRCKNVLWAVGGPAGMYGDSVYPKGHFGASGTAFAAGAAGQNLTEWQYGLASVKPRWNVSGTYMQCLPRFFSVNSEGTEEREFLGSCFDSQGELLTKVFLKGYQWPFDVNKIENGSSLIDILVYLEQKKGRRVFLDFRTNPGGEKVDYSALSQEARSYLEKAGACFGTPVERLIHMNQPAYQFFKDKGVDLKKEPLEIALCAQHNNGGLAVDCWWQTKVQGLFAAGEAAGTHGVYRPGGSALNAGQVGSDRAAQFIAAYGDGEPDDKGFQQCLEKEIKLAAELEAVLTDNGKSENAGEFISLQELWKDAQADMSRYGAAIRSIEGLKGLLIRTRERRQLLGKKAKMDSLSQLRLAFRLRDMLLCQQVYVEAMIDYGNRGGSRGSALYTDPTGIHPCPNLPEEFTYRLDGGALGNMIQETFWKEGACHVAWRQTRPIPEEDDFFENVWKGYRENRNIY